MILNDDVLKIGAEARISRTYFLGRKAVLKQRVRKSYRDERLDRRITVQRIRNEARCMVAARNAGLNVPRIYDVDEDEGRIVMEFIDGRRLNQLLYEADRQYRISLETLLGSSIGLMHSSGISHGDITTSNVIVRDDLLYFIDFSFASRFANEETMGVDIRLLREVYRSTHTEFESELGLIEDAYLRNGGKHEILEKADEIQSRARYT
ncbi:MAG: Kae1-associated serine/threonine protein kinase [Candidatus Thermoplasmatota archaeon]|jgi:Kae1-associated kinase Bud32|nr:Kae1-associated serine/threonine protein kinase [Candidatus Thermoplasmatota archaeon]